MAIILELRNRVRSDLSYISNFQAILNIDTFSQKTNMFTPVILALRKLRQEDGHDFHPSLSCIISLGQAGIQRTAGLLG